MDEELSASTSLVPNLPLMFLFQSCGYLSRNPPPLVETLEDHADTAFTAHRPRPLPALIALAR